MPKCPQCREDVSAIVATLMDVQSAQVGIGQALAFTCPSCETIIGLQGDHPGKEAAAAAGSASVASYLRLLDDLREYLDTSLALDPEANRPATR